MSLVYDLGFKSKLKKEKSFTKEEHYDKKALFLEEQLTSDACKSHLDLLD